MFTPIEDPARSFASYVDQANDAVSMAVSESVPTSGGQGAFSATRGAMTIVYVPSKLGATILDVFTPTGWKAQNDRSERAQELYGKGWGKYHATVSSIPVLRIGYTVNNLFNGRDYITNEKLGLEGYLGETANLIGDFAIVAGGIEYIRAPKVVAGAPAPSVATDVRPGGYIDSMTADGAPIVEPAVPAPAVSTPRAPSSPTQVQHPTFQPGPFANKSIPAKSTAQTFTQAERAQINRIGQNTGCHTCGTKVPGTKSGNFVPDHQPVSAQAPPGTAQDLFPQCLTCSREQGLAVARAKRGATKP